MDNPGRDQQFCFIISVSDDLYKEECLTYLNSLNVPDGYTTDIITIQDADSVSAAYNAAMLASEAKYKIYLKPETFIIYPDFLKELLHIFADPQIGMIGVVGTQNLSEDGVMLNGPRIGKITSLERSDESLMFLPEEPAEGISDVVVVDERLIATQVDLPWREDLFSDAGYSAMAQSLEFHKAGYRVVVTAQQPDIWYRLDSVTHQQSPCEEDRVRFLKEYGMQLFEGRQPKKRILYPNMKTIATWNIPWALTLQGVEAVMMEFYGTPERRLLKDINMVSRRIRELHAQAVMTHDYMAPIAAACAENDVPYIAWVYDSIQIALYDSSVQLPVNYIFDFDRLQIKDTLARGARYVRHMPLAANVNSMDRLEISTEDEKRYSCDISFIGSLYSNKAYQLPTDRLSAETQEEVRQLLQREMGYWNGKVRFFDQLSDRAVAEIAGLLEGQPIPERMIIGDRGYIEQAFFSRGVSHMERVEALKRLAKPGRDIRLYTKPEEKDNNLPGVLIQDGLEYNTELPKAYYFSRINLNLTLPSIRSGVPLRVFDILGAGGFLLTNYQPEMDELFDLGKDLEVFHSFEEMEDKAEYYLDHEEARLRIALQGHRKVREKYTYEKMVGTILDMVSEDLEQQGRPGLR